PLSVEKHLRARRSRGNRDRRDQAGERRAKLGRLGALRDGERRPRSEVLVDERQCLVVLAEVLVADRGIPQKPRIVGELEGASELEERAGVVSAAIEVAPDLVLALRVAGQRLRQRHWLAPLRERGGRDGEEQGADGPRARHLMSTSRPDRGV